MNLLKWIYNKNTIEQELNKLKFKTETQEDRIIQLNKWNSGYLDHIDTLQREVHEKNEYIKELSAKKDIEQVMPKNNKYYGIINFEFESEKCAEFLYHFINRLQRFIEQDNRNVLLLSYDYKPALITNTILGFNANRWNIRDENSNKIHYLLNSLDHNLETLNMYGTDEQVNQFIQKLKYIDTELDDLCRELLK